MKHLFNDIPDTEKLRILGMHAALPARINEDASFGTVNKSELDAAGNWSADYHINTKMGKKPYLKSGYHLEELGAGKSLPPGKVIYLRPDMAETLNKLGTEIRKGIEQFNQLIELLD